MHPITIVLLAVATAFAGWLAVEIVDEGVLWSTRLGYLAYISAIAPSVFLYYFVASALASRFTGWLYVATAVGWCVLAAVPMYWLALALSLGLLMAVNVSPWLWFVPVGLAVNTISATVTALAFSLLALGLFGQLLVWSGRKWLLVKQGRV